jgi:hypothetical protein
MVLNIVLMTLGLVALVESLIVLFFSNWAIKAGKKLNRKTIKRIGWIGFLIAIILFIIGMNI